MTNSELRSIQHDGLGKPNSDSSFSKDRKNPVSFLERRSAPRVPLIARAEVIVGTGGTKGVFNCLVLDRSSKGVLIDFGTPATLPDEMTLNINGGENIRAKLIWNVGTKAGLLFIGDEIRLENLAILKRKIAEGINRGGVVSVMDQLRENQFFGSEALCDAAETAELNQERVIRLLSGE